MWLISLGTLSQGVVVQPSESVAQEVVRISQCRLTKHALAMTLYRGVMVQDVVPLQLQVGAFAASHAHRVLNISEWVKVLKSVAGDERLHVSWSSFEHGNLQ